MSYRFPNQIDGCQIWPGCPGKGFRDASRSVTFMESSPRAGGPYKINDFALEALRNASDKERALLTTILLDQREQGIECPVVNEALVAKARTRPSLPIYQRAERLLRLTAKKASGLTGYVYFRPDSFDAFAWTESTEWNDVEYLHEFLREMKWIRGQTGVDNVYGQLTADGHARIAEQRANLDSSQVFVAMWFDESMNQAFEAGVEPAIKEAGYKPLRIDRKEHVNKIDDEIIAELRRSRFVVADFTQGDDGARGGVYYEAGYAHGLNLPVIFTCREDAVETLHFDTAHYNHIVWTTPEELRKKLKTRILAVIGEGPETQPNP